MMQRWSAGEAGVGLWLSVPDSSIAENLGTLDPAYLVVDMQHGLIDYSDVRHMFQAIQQSAATPLIRVPWNEPGIIGKVLDAGAMGVIVPMVNTAEEAAQAVRSCFYQPIGARSHGPVRAGVSLGEGYALEANDQVACIPMIETVEAIENIDQILAVPGVNAIYVGPADLSRTLGLPPLGDHDDPLFTDALHTILAACKAAGIPAGIHANPTIVRKRLDQGFQMVTATSDLIAVMAGAKAALAGEGSDSLY